MRMTDRMFPTLAVAVVLIAFPAATGIAQDGTSWVRFPGQTYDAATQPAYDRQLIKEWESQPPKGFPTLSAENLSAMKGAIKRYDDVVKGGGFPVIPQLEKGNGIRQMSLGLLSPLVALVKTRLTLSGDMRDQENDGSTNFDYALEKAVKRFQASNGLTPTGVVDPRTIDALNVPAQARLKQLQTNVNRLTELARGLPKKYVLVNIPAAQIEAVEGNEVASRHSGVVGKIDRPTPILRSQIHQLNFNPVWHLPPTVVSKDLIPKGIDMQRRGQDVLAKMGIDAYAADGRKLESSKIIWTAASSYSSSSSPAPRTRSASLKSTSTTPTPFTCIRRRLKTCSVAISGPPHRVASASQASSNSRVGYWPTKADGASSASSA
jgi:L,D-transpeptidase YcbB